MKKFLETIGMLSLICFSFFYTEKIGTVVKEVDDLMVLIKSKSEEVKIEPIDAKIDRNTIIPGYYGLKVDVDKSYEKMKRVGSWEENLLEYKKVLPNISLKNNYDKYVIGGNNKKNAVSFIFLVNEDSNIQNIRKILNEKEIKGNFFIDGMWLEKNNDLVSELIKEGHNIGNLSYNKDYSSSYFVWMDTILKSILKQKYSFCFMEEENENYLNICALNKNYTIKPSSIITTYPMVNLKKDLSSGGIYSFAINEYVEKELSTMIQYVSSRGLNIVSLSDLLNEKEK